MTQEVKKLWQVEDNLHEVIQDYTAGNDVVYDQILLPYDIKGTVAHAKMLAQQKILTTKELKAVLASLDQLIRLWDRGEFVVTAEQEDAHTAIEQYLTKNLGDIGKKIHTGRSRNDQATLMVRLYLKEKLSQIEDKLKELVDATTKSAQSFKAQPMPGYTHMQKAMPTDVTTWLLAYRDGWADCEHILGAVAGLIDQNPLGSASGFGINNFKNDRQLTTKLLGFKKIQDNPQYVGLSRGLFENSAIQSLVQFMLITNRFATDMMIFTTKEFNFFTLPKEFTTGSSIMPNKRNYDLFEIMRSNCATVLADQHHISATYAKLMSGYNRDLQTIKGSLMRSIDLVLNTIEVLTLVLPEIKANTGVLKQAMTEDLYTTEKVYDLVNKGMSFREAYLSVKKDLAS